MTTGVRCERAGTLARASGIGAVVLGAAAAGSAIIAAVIAPIDLSRMAILLLPTSRAAWRTGPILVSAFPSCHVHARSAILRVRDGDIDRLAAAVAHQTALAVREACAARRVKRASVRAHV